MRAIFDDGFDGAGVARIFINYRRGDAIATAGRLHDRLARAFGRGNIFMDVDHIPPGVDFVTHLHAKVSACEVLLALIGREWLDARDADGGRRLDSADDFVAIEIASAISRGVTVVPVLIDGAPMPSEAQLPERLKLLARRNAVEIRNTQFGSDVDRLIDKVRGIVKPRAAARLKWPAALAALALLGFSAWYGVTHLDRLPIGSRGGTGGQAAMPKLPAPEAYCESMKRVLAAADTRFDSILGRALGDNRIAQVPLPDWDDCIVFMESRFTDTRRYQCSFSGFADLQSSEKAAEEIAADLKSKCLGDTWAIGRAFATDGKRRTRLVSESSKAEISLNPSRIATATSWSLDLNVQY